MGGIVKRTRKILIGTAAVAALAGGGAAVAGATGSGDESDARPSADAAAKARQAALAHTGGGTANQIELDNEKGATYEVEVAKTDGSTVDVRLDDAFKVVAADSDSEG
jgi:uncharacterized membrane protein YkoI